MLEQGQKLELKIVDVAFGGKGVARHEEQVIFVPYVDTGERVLAEITQIKKNYAEARLLEVLEPSEKRSEPKCKYFYTCAGCQYQHLAYERQLEIKHKQLTDTLRRIGGLEVPVETVRPSPLPYGYRNKLTLTWIAGRLGLFANDNHTIVSVDRCEISQDEINAKITTFRARKIKPPRSGKPRQSFILRTSALEKKLPDYAFAQVNDAMAPEMMKTVAELLEPADLLVDAYCGSGAFALELAGCAKKVVGIELHARAVELARNEAAARGLKHVEFHADAVETALERLLAKAPEDVALILDPPREGCQAAVIDFILKRKPRQIVYVSCNPSTLARDLHLLSGAYQAERVVPLDMFPQTQHLEVVCRLTASPAKS